LLRRWCTAGGFAPSSLDEVARAQQRAAAGDRRGIFDGPLSRVMRRLQTDQSPRAILDATLFYNQLIEGVGAIAGYHRWDQTFRRPGKLPGLQARIQLTQRDERRHIAYGTYLGGQIIAENPDLWEWVEQRWAKLSAGLSGYAEAGEPTQEPDLGIDVEYQRQLARRRLEALAVARTMNLSEVD